MAFRRKALREGFQRLPVYYLLGCLSGRTYSNTPLLKGHMKACLLSISVVVLASLGMAQTTKAITYKVRLASGASQFYRLEVPPNVELSKKPLGKYKMSAGLAVVAAVAWAGGTSPSALEASAHRYWRCNTGRSGLEQTKATKPKQHRR
jgi:hypothetical protein